MTSYLIDLVLLTALVVTALRSGRMYRELRLLRSSGNDLGAALQEADRSINRAAEAVVVLKHEGVQTLRALEARIDEAREECERLERCMERADWSGRQRLPDRTAA
ncbi:MAG TPA: hypothetical protein VGO17_00875 [Aurantimonas sp.]|jgi:hypothetical protein|nr:hypothetical protein [Aurantimonas sp.]